ncbi:MAG: type IV toxin-antitoxin system AbiEi family antitoxin [Burkholderiales bacterium]|jgi:hypothetical protein
MNTPPKTDWVDRAAAALQPLGLTLQKTKQPRGVPLLPVAAWVRVAKGREHIDYLAEAKRTVTPATLGAMVMQLRHLAETAGRPVLLVTDYLTPQVAEALRNQQQQFADAAGNAYLEGPGLLVYVAGRKLMRGQTAPRANKTFATAGLKVLFALLCDPALADAPYRDIAVAAGVALGAVPAALADLRQARHLLVTDKIRRLHATKRLLDEWALAYAHTLRPKTLLKTYVAPNFGTWPDWHLDPEQARWGGEPAANLLVRYLRPGVLTIYADKLPPRLIVEQRLELAGPLAQDHLLELRKPFWGRTLRTEGRPDTVPPALVYADLLATGDARCIETAQMIYDDCLARLLPAA